jgi:tRNA G10  N-methylase Trm11
MKEYLVRLAQIHESFRTAELRALAVMAGTEMEIVRYDDDVGVSFFFSVSPFNIFAGALIQVN